MRPKAKTPKPRVDYTKKIRADRREALLDAAAKRMGLLDWAALMKWARECVEEPSTDQGVNTRLRDMLSTLIKSIPGGDPSAPPADIDAVRALYPKRERHPKVAVDGTNLSEQTMKRITAGIEKYSLLITKKRT